MRILYVVPYAPTPIRSRPYHLIRALARLGHAITVATVWETAAERDHLAQLARDGIEMMTAPLTRARIGLNTHRAIVIGEPIQAHYSWQPALARQLGTITDRGGHSLFDVIHIEHLRGAAYGLALQAQGGDLPIIWDSVDCISHLFQQAVAHNPDLISRWTARFELSRTRRFEARMVGQFDQVIVTSQIDKKALERLRVNTLQRSNAPTFQHSNISVLSNGVDLDRFHPAHGRAREPATLVVTGKMSYHANRTMIHYLVREIMPRIWAERPKVKLVIAGKDPGREILAMNRLPNITVTGTVADLRPYIQRATLAVVPLVYGAGVQNKVLEAMACATPVVASGQAAAALAAVPGRDLLTAGDATTFPQAVLALLDDPTRRQAIGAAGRAYVESNHNWTSIAAQFEGFYELARAGSAGQPG